MLTSASARSRRRLVVPSELDEAIADFTAVRPRLVGIAHRILGSASEAEDVVQEAWLRWQRCDRSGVRSATAVLVTTTTRLAINAAKSARARHEVTVGEWLSEPAVADDPTQDAERAEDLAWGIRVLLQRLSPTERAAYVLRHAFDYPYPRIAEILGLSESNARQIVSRACKHLAGERRRPADPVEHDVLCHAVAAAARHGEVVALEHALVAGIPGRGEEGAPVHGARETGRPERLPSCHTTTAETVVDAVRAASREAVMTSR